MGAGYSRSAILAVALIAAVTAACERKRSLPPDTLVVALEAAPRRFDPRMAGSAVASKVGDLLFNGLLRRTDDLTLAPDLAADWSISGDGLTYTFTLRSDIVFHNGAPVTSADVAATYRFILDPANASPYRGAFAVIASIDTPDAATVVFRLSQPSAPLAGSLTQAIVPAEATPEVMDATPVGTGPFRFVSYELEQRLTLVKNEAYHAGPPKIAGVVVTFIPDETVRTLELEAGGVDIVMNPITPDLLPRLRRQDHLKIETRVGTNYSYLGFNLHDPVVGRRAVREALAHAIDRQAIVDHILKGLAAVAAGPLSPSNPYYVADLPVYDYDPAKAARLLDAAGFPDPDGDGPASRMRLNYATSQNELRKRIAEVFQYQLAKIGVELVIDSMEWGTFFGRIQKGEFQVYSLTWVGIVDPDIFHNIFHSASLPPGGANRGGYVDADIDRLLDEGRRVVGDKRNEVYAEAQRIVARDLPYVSLWHGVNVAVANRRVTGFVVTPDENLKSVVGVTLAEEKP